MFKIMKSHTKKKKKKEKRKKESSRCQRKSLAKENENAQTGLLEDRGLGVMIGKVFLFSFYPHKLMSISTSRGLYHYLGLCHASSRFQLLGARVLYYFIIIYSLYLVFLFIYI
jgi:hypothetical protein